MTNRDRDSVAKLLLAVADRLAEAPHKTSVAAQQFAAERPGMDDSIKECHQVGALEMVCKLEAETIRGHVREYLTPRQPKIKDAS